MTDRVQYLTVALDRDMRDDDVQHVIDAIRMMKFVKRVKMGEPLDMADYLARTRVGIEIRERVVEVLDEIVFDRKKK